MTSRAAFAVGVMMATYIGAQSPAPAFEVATMKSSPPAPGDLININLGTFRNGKLTFANASLSDCLKFAYDIVADAQLSGPDWIKSKDVRFDIVAEVPPNTTRDQVAVMLRTLLADRLKLAVHYEERQMGYLALVVGKNRAKLREAQAPPGPVNPAVRGRIEGRQMSMKLLATLLSRFERTTVIDRTGLTGIYEVSLRWAPDDRPAAELEPDVAGAGSIFNAVQEQLGLKLESRKGPLDVLVVDHAEKVPAEN